MLSRRRVRKDSEHPLPLRYYYLESLNGLEPLCLTMSDSGHSKGWTNSGAHTPDVASGLSRWARPPALPSLLLCSADERADARQREDSAEGLGAPLLAAVSAAPLTHIAATLWWMCCLIRLSSRALPCCRNSSSWSATPPCHSVSARSLCFGRRGSLNEQRTESQQSQRKPRRA